MDIPMVVRQPLLKLDRLGLSQTAIMSSNPDSSFSQPP
jgi:hypothetical protein